MPLYQRFVAPNGTGDGCSASSPAAFNDTSFWALIHQLRTKGNAGGGACPGEAVSDAGPVHVQFAPGSYADTLQLTGQASHHSLTLSTSDNRAAFDTTNPSGVHIEIMDCTNVSIEGFDFRGAASISVRIRGLSENTEHIAFRNCTWKDLINCRFGAIFTPKSSPSIVNHLSVIDCQFQNVGTNLRDHFIYAQGPYMTGLNILGCRFENCSGSFVKLRDSIFHARIERCEFYMANPRPNGVIPSFIDIRPEQGETFGNHYSICGNHFQYGKIDAGGSCTLRGQCVNGSGSCNLSKRSIAIDFVSRGSPPEYELDASQRTILQSGTKSQMQSVLSQIGLAPSDQVIGLNRYICCTKNVSFGSCFGASSRLCCSEIEKAFELP